MAGHVGLSQLKLTPNIEQLKFLTFRKLNISNPILGILTGFEIDKSALLDILEEKLKNTNRYTDSYQALKDAIMIINDNTQLNKLQQHIVLEALKSKTVINTMAPTNYSPIEIPQEQQDNPYAECIPTTLEDDLSVPPINQSDAADPNFDPNKLCAQTKQLGKGAFGEVYQATYEGQTVAVKVCAIDTPAARSEFLQEMAISRRISEINSPYLAKTISCGYLDGNPVIVNEFLGLGSLDNCLENNDPPLSIQDKHRILCDIAHGLKALHQNGIVHRDIAARNVLLYRDDSNQIRAKITDWGRTREMTNGEYKSINSVGPLRWMHPSELVDKVSTSQTDLWGFATLVNEVMNDGKLPYNHIDNILTVAHEVAYEGLNPIVDAQSTWQVSTNLDEKSILVAIAKLQREAFEYSVDQNVRSNSVSNSYFDIKASPYDPTIEAARIQRHVTEQPSAHLRTSNDHETIIPESLEKGSSSPNNQALSVQNKIRVQRQDPNHKLEHLKKELLNENFNKNNIDLVELLPNSKSAMRVNITINYVTQKCPELLNNLNTFFGGNAEDNMYHIDDYGRLYIYITDNNKNQIIDFSNQFDLSGLSNEKSNELNDFLDREITNGNYRYE